MTRIELLYSKLVFRLNTEKRMATYRKLSSLLRNNFTLMEALSRIEKIESKGGTKPNEPFAILMREWQKNLERGQSFPEASRGWVPINETLLLTLGDVSKLSIALDNISRVTDGVEKIKRSILSAVAYPLFLLALTLGIIIMVGLYLVPPLREAAGTEIIWRGTAASLVWIADFSKDNWHLFVSGFIATILAVWFSLSNWSGKLRGVFDKLPPWSMYKVQSSVSWLISLSAMVAAGCTIPSAMKMLSDNSNKYLSDILESTLRFISNGDNLGVALANTKRGFPNEEIIGDLAIYADMNSFDQNLSKIANDYLDESVRRMESISSTFNSVGILLISIIIGWVVFGTFQMQDQITSALT
ncbi:MAG: type II secretion system F family protein [Alphaproteobacteria bacterium]|nr:type II secretion system F family protein [Alphaproteobacteria bacterium]MBN2674948.1 type II secretion system F family protein [Alphaproteobacteria bacterium]